jgi:predicted phosphodiesterase
MGGNSIKYAILGDIHANLEALEAVLRDAHYKGCTDYACVGDIVGYNADPSECLEIVRGLKMTCVKGNHDEYSSTEISMTHFNPRAAAAILWTRRQLSETDKSWLRDLRYVRLVSGFSLVHATLDAPNRWGYVFERLSAAASFNYQTTQVCFFGHTHLPMAFVRDSHVHAEALSTLPVEPGRKYFVNVGSVGEPRDGNSLATYATYDLHTNSIELRRVAYDLGKTEEKVRAAGLVVRVGRTSPSAPA